MCIFQETPLWQSLGHLASSKGIYLFKKKLETILNLVPPRNVTKTRNKIGLVSYYITFVVNITDKVKHLTELKKKNTTFNWNPHCQQSIKTIKEALTNSPILIFPDPNETYVLLTDASRHSWSRVLTQKFIITIRGKA